LPFKKEEPQIIVIGSGLSSLVCAAYLVSKGLRNIALYATAYGGTPYIAGINFMLDNNPYGDSKEQYIEDMKRTGFALADTILIEKMASYSAETYEFLAWLGVPFSTLPDGTLKRRLLSGSTYPRTLCSTKGLIGIDLINTLESYLHKNGIEQHFGYRMINLDVEDERVVSVGFVDAENKEVHIPSDIVVAGWGGIGTLLGASTYPKDVNGKTLGIAYNAHIALADLEFIEYEPMVVMHPPKAAGEPCPTAMLGEGATLLNKHGERFLLKVRPQGEKGAGKSLLNDAIWEQVQRGQGSEHGGCFVDLRMIPKETLQLYPWFYQRLIHSGCDPTKELIEVGPLPHSYSGGVKVDQNCCSSLANLYAIGEAAAGFHGACRMAGNAAAQAAISGVIASLAIVEHAKDRIGEKKTRREEHGYCVDVAMRKEFLEIAEKVKGSLGVYRDGQELQKAFLLLEDFLAKKTISHDTESKHQAEALLLIISAAIKRTESRGSHKRVDYPTMDQCQALQYIWKKEKETNGN